MEPPRAPPPPPPAPAPRDGRASYRDALAEGPRAPLREKLIGHRGWHRLGGKDTAARPLENTREAYLAAVDIGLPLAECDVWDTSDGEIVLAHDRCMRSMAEDEGDPAASAAIADLPWADLRQLKLQGGAAPVLLRTVLEDLVGTGTRLVVELKSSGPAAPLAAMLGADSALRGSVAYVMSFSLAALEGFAEALKAKDVRVLWLVDNPVVPYPEEVKNEGETTFDYCNETLTMFLARLDLTARVARLGCGLHVQYHPCLTPSHVHAWRAELASLPGAGPEAPRAAEEEERCPFVGLWGGVPGFDRAASLVGWLPAVSGVNTDLPADFWDGQ